MKETDQRRLDQIADDLLDALVVLHRRMIREISRPGERPFDPSRFVLKKVQEFGPIPMSEIGRHMEISKPYMTALVNKLISEGLVERVTDPRDRRLIRIKVTASGRRAVKEFTGAARNAVIRNLSTLSAEDIKLLHESMRNVRAIFSKLDQARTGMSESG